jgi:exopolysaccharide biosynthesis polyprenyl glycosylphosphotransferase
VSATAPDVVDYLQAAAAGVVADGSPSAQARKLAIRASLAAADVVALAASFAIASASISSPSLQPTRAGLLLFAAGWFAVAAANRLYGRDIGQFGASVVHDAARVLQASAVAVAVSFDLAGPLLGRDFLGGAPFALLWALLAASVITCRGLVRALVWRTDLGREKVLVLGAKPDVDEVVAQLERHSEYRLEVAGTVTGAPGDGSLEDVTRRASALGVTRIVVTHGAVVSEDDQSSVRELLRRGVIIHAVSQLREVPRTSATAAVLDGVPVLTLEAPPRASVAVAVKRMVDIVVSATALVLLAPLFAFIALRIRLDSDGPILFRQQRLGMGMRRFTCLKFRTMRVGTSSEEHAEYIRQVMNGRSEPEAHGLFKLARAADVTPFGQWLRRTSLDELPQLINVLRGEMSLVGPRPCLLYEVEHFAPHHFERFTVPAGITGYWQVFARGHSSFREALEMDVTYARSWSLWLDLRLIARTPLEMLRLRKTC